MITIRHPRPEPGRQHALGVDFRDGVATVDELHPERALALTQHGFTIDTAIAPNPESGSFVDLTTLTIPELRDIAETEGVDLPARARKAEIIDALSRTPAEPIPGSAGPNEDGSHTAPGIASFAEPAGVTEMFVPLGGKSRSAGILDDLATTED